jgi:hypothetical protein
MNREEFTKLYSKELVRILTRQMLQDNPKFANWTVEMKTQWLEAADRLEDKFLHLSRVDRPWTEEDKRSLIEAFEEFKRETERAPQ